MRRVVLGELLAPAQVQRAGDANYPVLSMTMHAGLVTQTERFKKRIASLDTSEYKVVKNGQLVVGFPINEGVLDFQLRYDAAVVSPAYGIWDVRDESILDRRYLQRYLKSPHAIEYYIGKMKGSTARRRSLPPAEFNAMPIPLPSVSEQRRIAAVLDRADAIRTKRFDVLAHLDSLTRAIFRDMFGDPVLNERDLPRIPIGSLAVVLTGNSPSRSEPANFGSEIEWLKSDNLGDDVATRAAEGLSSTGMRRARLAPAGSVLVTCIAGSPASIGKASLVDRDVTFNQQINAVLPSEKIDPVFLLGQLKTSPELVRAKSTGGMKGLVNKSAFSSIEVLSPSAQDQEEYARRARKVTRLRGDVARVLAADDDLLASLQARAFRGEL